MRPFLIVLLAILSAPISAWSQGSPAFDSNVYFPDLDNPNEIETLVSTKSDPYRQIIKTIPASDVSPYGQLMFLGPPGVSHKIAKGGPDFTTERIKSPQNLYLPDEAEFYFAHFRGPKYTDMLCKYYLFNGYRIYWSDDDGNYSPSRYSSLKMPIDTGVIGYWPDRGA